MPFVDVKLTRKLNCDEEKAIKTELGKIIEVFPGKSESWLMCSIDADKKIWFRGDNSEDSAFIEVKLFGAVNPEGAEKFTAAICDYFNKFFGIEPSRIYVRFEGGSDWGWNGSNF